MTDIQKHEIEQYGLDHNTCAGLSLSKEKQDRKEHFRNWLDSMTPGQRIEHLKREEELQEKRKLNHLY